MQLMKGKRAVITGPTSGIGRQMALELGAMGAELILACCEVARGKQAARKIAGLGAPSRASRPMPSQRPAIGC
jgi:NAD(P)-dependent dehydrogenase (short-subunit alcohol dehydrogenase family)